MLTVTDLTYSLRNELILNKISFTASEGEITGIIGRAGSGKSALMDIIQHKIKDYNGRILLDNQDAGDLKKIRNIRKLISYYASCNNTFNPEAAVKDWVLSGRIIHKKWLNPYSDMDREIASREITNFKLNHLENKRLKHISETDRSLASVAKVFAARPAIMLLEKPDSGLNINQRVILTRCIKKYAASGKAAVLVTSGDLNFIASTCDRILVLNDNEIAESGTQRMITAEFIKKYFNVDAVVTRNIHTGLPEIQVIEES